VVVRVEDCLLPRPTLSWEGCVPPGTLEFTWKDREIANGPVFELIVCRRVVPVPAFILI
jgi:hypothetical protein